MRGKIGAVRMPLPLHSEKRILQTCLVNVLATDDASSIIREQLVETGAEEVDGSMPKPATC